MYVNLLINELLMIVVVNVILWIGYELCWVVVVDYDDFEWMWSL